MFAAANRILVVDDDEEALRVVTDMLIHRGYEVLGFLNPALAVERLVDSPVDVIVTDLSMPGMSGLQVLRRVREDRPGLPVILVSGWADYNNAENFHKAGFFAVLSKPVLGDDLETAIRAALEESGGP